MAQTLGGKEYVDLINRPVYDKGCHCQTKMSVQQMKDKIGKNKAYAVCKSALDFEKKSIVYEIVKGKTDSTVVEVKFDEIDNIMGWRKHKFVDDGMNVRYESKAYGPKTNGKGWCEYDAKGKEVPETEAKRIKTSMSRSKVTVSEVTD